MRRRTGYDDRECSRRRRPRFWTRSGNGIIGAAAAVTASEQAVCPTPARCAMRAQRPGSGCDGLPDIALCFRRRRLAGDALHLLDSSDDQIAAYVVPVLGCDDSQDLERVTRSTLNPIACFLIWLARREGPRSAPSSLISLNLKDTS